MDDERPSGTETIESVEIDYDRFDVAVIMAQVKRIAASRPVEPTREESSGTAEEPPVPVGASSGEAAPPGPPVPIRDPSEAAAPSSLPAPVGTPSGAAAPSGPPNGRKARIKAKLLRAMKPFFPIIRFFGLPLHEDIRAAVLQIDAANRRRDVLAERLDHRFDELSGRFDHRFDELSRSFDHRLVEVSERFDYRFDELSRSFDHRLDEISGRFDHRFDEFSHRVDFRLVDLDRSVEYIKLLHTLDHNLVVETTKLRIEFEVLKSKFRSLEKELESQVQRERTLEKRLLS